MSICHIYRVILEYLHKHMRVYLTLHLSLECVVYNTVITRDEYRSI